MNIAPTTSRYGQLHSATDTSTIRRSSTALHGTLNNHTSTPPSVTSIITELKHPTNLENYTVLTTQDGSEHHSQEQESLAISQTNSQTKINNFNNAKNIIEKSITKKQSRKFLHRLFYTRSAKERTELARAHTTLAVHYATGLYEIYGDTILPKDLEKCIHHFQQAAKVSKNGDPIKGKAWYALAKLSLTVTDFDRIKNKNCKSKSDPFKTAKKYLKRSKKAGYSPANDFFMAMSRKKNGSEHVSPREMYFRIKYDMYRIRGMVASQEKHDDVQKAIAYASDFLTEGNSKLSPDTLKIQAYIHELECMRFTMASEPGGKSYYFDYNKISGFIANNPMFPGLNSAFGEILAHQGKEDKEFCDLAASQGNPLPALIVRLQKNLSALCACDIPNTQAGDSNLDPDIIHIETERLFYDFVRSCASVSHEHGQQTNKLMMALLNNLDTQQSDKLLNILEHIDINEMTEATSKYLNHITKYGMETQHMADHYAEKFKERIKISEKRSEHGRMIDGGDIKEFLKTIPENNEEYQFNVENQRKLASTTLKVLSNLNQYAVKKDIQDTPTISASTFKKSTKGRNQRVDGATLFHLQNLNLFIPQTTLYGWSEGEKCIDYRKVNYHALGFLSDNMNHNKKSRIDKEKEEKNVFLTKEGMECLLLKTSEDLKNGMYSCPIYKDFYVDSARQHVCYGKTLPENESLSEDEVIKKAVLDLFNYCKNDGEVDIDLFIALANVLNQTYFDPQIYCDDVLHSMAGKSSKYQKYASPSLYVLPLNPDKTVRVDKVRDDLYTVEFSFNTGILTYKEQLTANTSFGIMDIGTEYISKDSENHTTQKLNSGLGTVRKRSVISVIKQEDGTWQYRFDLIEAKVDLENCTYNDNTTVTKDRCRHLDELEVFIDQVNRGDG